MKIVSLGQNCEVSFRIKDFFNKPIDSYIFSWAALYKPIKALEIIDNLNVLFESDWSLLPWGMIKNERFEIGFHLRKTKEELFNSDGSINEANYKEALDEFIPRLKHLVEKTEALFSQEEDVMFIYKIEPSFWSEDLAVLTMLYHKLKFKITKNGNKNDFFLLLIVVGEDTANSINSMNISENILACPVGFFPVPDDRKRGGDQENFKKAISLGLNAFKKYKKSKLVDELLDNGNFSQRLPKWNIVKSGDAIGNFDVSSRVLSCSSKSFNYFGITAELINVNQYVGRKLELYVKLKSIDSERADVGYIQIWENLFRGSETKSVALINIVSGKTEYLLEYTPVQKTDKSRVVIQVKNGSIEIERVSFSPIK